MYYDYYNGATPNMQGRLQYLEQNTYPNYQQGFQPPQNFQQRLKINTFPVASFAEAQAAMIDFDGSLNVFIDRQNDCIYTKQLGNDGKSNIKVYKLSEDVPKVQYVSQEEFNNLFEQVKALQERLESGVKQNVTAPQYAKKQ